MDSTLDPNSNFMLIDGVKQLDDRNLRLDLGDWVVDAIKAGEFKEGRMDLALRLEIEIKEKKHGLS